MTRLNPTWEALLDVMLSNADIADRLTSEATGWLEVMARAADANRPEETTPVYWHSDDEVLRLLRDIATNESDYNVYRTRAKDALRD